MPVRGPLHHVDLSVSDLATSVAFYDHVLGYLGFERQPHSDPERGLWRLTGPSGLRFEIDLRESAGEQRRARPDRFAPGVHHLAFHAESRAAVDTLHELLIEIAAEILDAPAEYPEYEPGYYAVFFNDPDGLKLEVLYLPSASA